MPPEGRTLGRGNSETFRVTRTPVPSICLQGRLRFFLQEMLEAVSKLRSFGRYA